MKFTSKLAIAVAIASAAMPATAQRLGQDKPRDAKPQELPNQIPTAQQGSTTTTGRKLTVSKEAQKAIVEYQNAVNANDVAKLPGLLAAAQKVAKTPDDKFIIASNQTKAAVNANDLDGIRVGIEAMQASGSAETPDMAARYADLGNRYLKANRAADASAMLEKSIALDGNNASALTLLADIKSRGGDKAGALGLMQKSFIASKAAGKKVAEGNYKFATKMAADLNSPVALDITREWVAAYPTPDSWRAAVQLYRSVRHPVGQQLVDLWRVARANNAVKGEADYDSYLGALTGLGNLTEAKAVLADAAKQSNVDMTKTQFKAHSAKAAAAPTRAAVDAQVKAATTGPALIKAGDSLYGLGAYAEAATAYRAAVAKGGDTGLANLHLGMALAMSGDKAGAATAFKAVTGANADIARLWLISVGG